MSPYIVPVIMSGGSGTRLWPLSTPSKPKQFHNFVGDHSLFQNTLLRFSGPDFHAPAIIAGHSHLEHIRAQSKALAIEPMAILLEPMPRNTACVAAIAALCIRHKAPDALVLLAPADHIITKDDAFMVAIKEASKAARTHIVTFGISPTRPETGYGYIACGDRFDASVMHVSKFLEKPDAATAKTYVDGGQHVWNAGLFLFSPEIMLKELERFAPDVLNAARLSYENADTHDHIITLEAMAFARAPSISIDYAIMERTDLCVVKPCDIGWYDLGSFLELYNITTKDALGNVITGKASILDARNCLIHSPHIQTGVIGLNDILVIVTQDGVVIAPLSRAQDIKQIIPKA